MSDRSVRKRASYEPSAWDVRVAVQPGPSVFMRDPERRTLTASMSGGKDCSCYASAVSSVGRSTSPGSSEG
jgi:hypothetical protein